jgi:hypothetical protein
MPFLNTERKPLLRHPAGHPVAVRAAFNTTGQFVPRSFCIEDDTEELFKYKISSIKAIKEDKSMVKIFYCTFDAYGYRNDITLSYDIVRHHWVIG